MASSNRNLFILFQTGWLDSTVVEKEKECISKILAIVETPEQFCRAVELVDRNRIVHDAKKMLKESRLYSLRPFRFFINKN